ncbi:5'-nucleotidase [Marinibactrum halimedae]|uniref:5'-nucleotidase n=1 Tax=Marinibactrum halimedae TaxID=1444977 RepID=A0AA37T3S5_9GAMM|nr:5'-nucleotidase [Marinibactrum halimedae]MCD9460088.1 5'-nucleotidase [Marinibactrum halimedae]GLS26489.1 5'-nucleotidase [Marinibactrum halimedae]
MPADFGEKLVIAISSRALFDLKESHQVFVQEGLKAYSDYQIDREDDVLAPGEGFLLVKKLLHINSLLPGKPSVEVILVSRNSADTGLRVFNSIEHYQLDVKRAVFSGGASPHRYLSAFNSHLFLSTNNDDVTNALSMGAAAATLLPSKRLDIDEMQVRFAFDGDAVLFSDESERIYQQKGLKAFAENEKQNAQLPMEVGPFAGFLQALHSLQSEFDEQGLDCPIRTAMVTARSAPSHERVIRTLRHWGVRLDECLFLGGLSKGAFLKAYGADVFFDDQPIHCDSAKDHVTTGHVPHGIANT